MTYVNEDERFVRSAAWLFLTGGLLTLLTAWLPGSAIRSPEAVDAIGISALALGGVVWMLPWERWPRSASLALVPLALATVSMADAFGTRSPFTYDVFYIVVFAWVGLCHPPRTGLRLSPLLVPFFLVPALIQATPAPVLMSSLISTLAVGVVIGETVAWSMRETARARRQAEHRAALLHAVVEGTTTISGLDRDQVMVNVVEAVVGIDVDLAGLAIFSRDGTSWTLGRPRGNLSGHPGVRDPQPTPTGTPGRIQQDQAPILVDDYRRWPAATPIGLSLGLRSTVGAPVRMNGRMVGALIGASARRVLDTTDLEAVTMLADHAGRSLENAERFGREQRARRILAEVSIRDELTGVGNRRHASGLLAGLEPEDAVVMIDLDNFKSVNDTEGHDAGDRVLLALAGYLRDQVRDDDTVARYGGEEFLVVLRQVGQEGLPAVHRLCAGWRESLPRTTFSAGVAVHGPDDTPAATLGRADGALYQAKRAGRDRVCADFGQVAPVSR